MGRIGWALAEIAESRERDQHSPRAGECRQTRRIEAATGPDEARRRNQEQTAAWRERGGG